MKKKAVKFKFHYPFSDLMYIVTTIDGKRIKELKHIESANKLIYTIENDERLFISDMDGVCNYGYNCNLILRSIPSGEYMVRHIDGGISEIYESYAKVPPIVFGNENYMIYKMKKIQ